MKSSKIIVFFLCLIILMAVPVTAGAYSYSAPNTFSIIPKAGYTDRNMNNNRVPDIKETTSTVGHVKTIALTLTKNPVFKIVRNSVADSETMSDEKTVGNAGNTVVVGKNTAWKDGMFYAAVRPSVWQHDEGTIRLEFSAD